MIDSWLSLQPPHTAKVNSVEPVLMGNKQVVRNTLYGAYCGGTKPGMRCVRRGDWKLIKYDVLDGQLRETQLFNLAKNPNEFLLEHHDDSVVKFNGHKPDEMQKDLESDLADIMKNADLPETEKKRLLVT